MRLPDRRRWVTPVASGIAVLALLAVGAIVRAALGTGGTHPVAGPSVSPSLPVSLTPSPGPTGSSPAGPTPTDTATQAPHPAPGPGDPVPTTYPGRTRTKFILANHDPEYDVVYYIGTDRYGPLRPWEKTGWITHDTYAGLVFRMEFPGRHNCDDSARPLERPLTEHDQWAIHAQRTYMSHDCSTLSVSWIESDGLVPGSDQWSFQPSPTPTRTATTPPPPTPTATPSESATATP
jgi:hypothetical protein